MNGRAVFLVPLVLVAAAGAGFALSGPPVAALAVAGVLVVVAAARWLWRRDRPEGLAVRSWPVDVLVSLVLAVAIAVLAVSPGV